jgi:hypothetical protein
MQNNSIKSVIQAKDTDVAGYRSDEPKDIVKIDGVLNPHLNF